MNNKENKYKNIRFTGGFNPGEVIAKDVRKAGLAVLIITFTAFKIANAALDLASKATRTAFKKLGSFLSNQTETKKFFLKYNTEINNTEVNTEDFQKVLSEFISKQKYISARTLCENLRIDEYNGRRISEKLDELKITKKAPDRSLGREVLETDPAEILKRVRSGFIYRNVGLELNAKKNATLTKDIQITVGNNRTTYKAGMPLDLFQETLQARFTSLTGGVGTNDTKTNTNEEVAAIRGV